MDHGVDITFDCLPLRAISRLEIPMDASPVYRSRCERIKAALEKHGAHNSYFLYGAHCVFHLTNSEKVGTLNFHFDGTVLTDETDQAAASTDLEVVLEGETCEWLTEPIVEWFQETVNRAVLVEFDRYIAAGDLDKTRQRVEEIQAQSDESGGFMGMYL